MRDVLSLKSVKEIPELNIYQCGSCYMHSLKEAQAIAKEVVDRGIKLTDNKELELDLSSIDANRCDVDEVRVIGA